MIPASLHSPVLFFLGINFPGKKFKSHGKSNLSFLRIRDFAMCYTRRAVSLYSRLLGHVVEMYQMERLYYWNPVVGM